MAQFPQGLRQIESRCNAGERRVLDQLRQCLDDQHLVWHDLPVGETARQPDFIVLGPGLGLLLLEVKDWKLATIRQATPDRVELATASGPVMTAHPLRQVRDHAMALADALQRDPALVHDEGPHRGRLALRYGWGAVMSNLRRAEVAALPGFDAVFPPARTLLRDDLDDSVDPEAFVQRLSGLFTVDMAQRLTPAQRERIRWHLFPELRLGAPAPVPPAQDNAERPDPQPDEVPDLLQVMDLQQEQVARTLGEGHRVIHGVAGSGKTMILVHRARLLAHEAEPARPVLVLCYNRALADRIEALIAPDEALRPRLQVRTFHGWCAELARRHRIAVPPAPEGQDDTDAPARLARAVIAAADAGRVPLGGHHAVLIDEAHDFEDGWLRLAAAMSDPAARRLLVLYDDAQSIYQRLRQRFSFASVGIQARGRTSVLRLNYRNTAEVLGLALRFARGLLPERGRDREAGRGDEDGVAGVAPSSSGRRGPRPVLIRARSEHEEAELLAARIADAVAAGTAAGEIAVLCRTRAQMAPIAEALARRGLPLQSMGSAGFQHFDWRQAGIRLVTLHSAKGLEFAHVHVAGLQRLPWRDETLEDAVRLVYVAMTRATQSLVLSCCGSSPVVERLQAALQEQGLEPALQ